MKILFFFFIAITASTCGNNQQPPAETKSPTPSEVADTNELQQSDILVGKINFKDLQEGSCKAWFEPMYQSYEPDSQSLQQIKEHIDAYQIKLFMGTWCSDSQREVPKFLKLLEQADYDLNQIEIQAVRRDKTLPTGLQEEYDVHFVPTIIFFKDGKEVGRFVEYPQESLAADIAKIVSGEAYKHSYSQ